jgi:orotidine-5'-phosphate decarboxylase
MANTKIIVALDCASAREAEPLLDKLPPDLCKVKIGKELFTAEGPAFVERVVGRGFKVFLDLKFHDIPQTVAKACHAAAGLGIWMINVHASGGRAMMLASREALEKQKQKERPLLVAVTVLTSLDAEALAEIGVTAEPEQQVRRLALLAQECSLDGVVCSGREASMLRQVCDPHFLLVTPGIRPVGAALDDQKRILTPPQAIRDGANYLVVGRPITQAPDPEQALHEIIDQVKQGEPQ